MDKTVYQQKFLVFLVMVLIAPSAWSNRCAGRGCNPPAFKDMVPAAGSAVSRGSDFSFTASPNTNPRSIRVMVKGHEVALEIEQRGPIRVRGKLPSDILGAYARVNITGSSSQSSCVGNGGWLLKIGD